jgi:hypothetical protein
METLCLIRVLLIKLLRPNIIRMGGQSVDAKSALNAKHTAS